MKKVMMYLLLALTAISFANSTNTFRVVKSGTRSNIQTASREVVYNDKMNKDRATSEVLLEEGFEGGALPSEWLSLDEDGDTHLWAISPTGMANHTGDFCFQSFSYDNTAGALTPDNWLVTPQISLGANGNVNYWVCAQDGAWAGEHYGVYVSTTGTAAADFTLLFEETMIGKEGKVAGAYYEKDVDLSAYTGNVYLAFRHFNCTDMFALNIDDITVTSDAATPPVVWTEVLADDFEGTTDNWTLEGTWGLTDEDAQSPTHSLTESPNANYADNLNISATLTAGIDLSAAAGAKINYNYKSDIETGFDYMYLELTTDDGTNWTNLKTYDEQDGVWTADSVDISGFVGNASVKLRFRFESDGGFNVTGMLIDDFVVSTTTTDVFAPFIIHNGPTFYEGTDQDFAITATALDFSAVSEVKAVYTLDSDPTEYDSPAFTDNGDDTFTGAIPAQATGVEVDYKIVATDSLGNVAEKGGYSYISGIHLIKDNGVVDFLTTFEASTAAAGAAVTFEMPDGKHSLDYMLIRNYMDNNNANDSMLVHVWADEYGIPGADLITPFMFYPEANSSNTSAMTRIDLRPYVSELDELLGQTFWIGFTVPSGKVHITMTNPGSFDGSSFVLDGTSGEWTEFSSTSGIADFHFRAIVGTSVGIQKEIGTVSNFELQQNYPNPFNPTTSISFALENNSNVKLVVFDAKGALVANLVNGNVNKGAHSVEFNATGLSTGVYYYSLKVNGVSTTKKMLLIK